MIVDKAKKIFDAGIEHANLRRLEEFEHLINKFESPIEQMMYAELIVNLLGGYGPVHIRPQVKVGKYRIDIAAYYLYGDDKVLKVAIECDGHDYHERTEEQARRDKKKDIYLQSKGWLVTRFTGKQINQDVSKCVDDINELVDEIFRREWLENNS